MNSTTRSIFSALVLVFVLVGVIAGVFWANLSYVKSNPGGNDFLVHWVGTQELIMNGVSPYSEEVAIRIQTLAYGRPAQPGEHELRVAYPIYASLIFAPFAIMQDFTVARAAWMTVLEIAIIALAFISINLARWRPNLFVLIIYFLFSILWYHSIRPLINGNAVILVALFITGALLAIRQDRDELAGILLGLATIKPQVAILILFFITLWALSRSRWRLLLWSYGSILIFSLIGIIFIPDWFIQNFYEVIRYPGYNPPGTPGAAFLEWFPGVGRQLGWGLTILMVAILIFEWIMAWGKSFEWFLWTACLTLVVSQWTGIQTDPGNYIVLFFPLVFVVVSLEKRWGKNAQFVSILIFLGLLFGLWLIFLRTVQYGGQPQQHPIMFFPLPFLLLIGLYWIRWWAIRPRRPLVDALNAL